MSPVSANRSTSIPVMSRLATAASSGQAIEMRIAEMEDTITIECSGKVWKRYRTTHELNIERIATSAPVQPQESSPGVKHRQPGREHPIAPQSPRTLGTELGVLGFHAPTPRGPDLSRRKILLTDRIRSEPCALALVRRYDCGC